jgi:uncharacterized membrane protein
MQNDNYIVTENPALIRYLSSAFSKGNFIKYSIGVIIYYLLVEGIGDILSAVFPASYYDVMHIDLSQFGTDIAANMPALAFSTFVYAMLLSGALLLGKTFYLLTYVRNNTIEYVSLTEGFSFFIKATLLYIVRTLIVSFLMLLLIVPGIIAYFSYSQAFYILADGPKKGIIQCLSESRAMMKGNKMRLFLLDVSYIFELFLGILPIAMGMFFSSNMLAQVNNLGIVLFGIVLSIPLYIAYSDMSLGQTVFYELMLRRGFKNFKYAAQGVFRSNNGTIPVEELRNDDITYDYVDSYDDEYDEDVEYDEENVDEADYDEETVDDADEGDDEE